MSSIIKNSYAMTALLIIFFLGSSAWAGANIMGKVADPVTGKPLAGIAIVALTNTNILEEKKQARIETRTDSKGEFVIKGALPHRTYSVSVSPKPGYVGGQTFVDTPDNSKTRIIDTALYTAKDPFLMGLGVALYNGAEGQNTNLPRYHDSNLIFRPNQVPVIRKHDSGIILVHYRKSQMDESITQITKMSAVRNPDKTISLKPTESRFALTSTYVGKGGGGELLYLKGNLPQVSEKTYFCLYAGFMWRQVYVFAVSPKTAEQDAAVESQIDSVRERHMDEMRESLPGVWYGLESQLTYIYDKNGTIYIFNDGYGYSEGMSVGKWSIDSKKETLILARDNSSESYYVDSYSTDRYKIIDKDHGSYTAERLPDNKAQQYLKMHEFRLSLPGEWKREINDGDILSLFLSIKNDGTYKGKYTYKKRKDYDIQGNWRFLYHNSDLTFYAPRDFGGKLSTYDKNKFELEIGFDKEKIRQTYERITDTGGQAAATDYDQMRSFLPGIWQTEEGAMYTYKSDGSFVSKSPIGRVVSKGKWFINSADATLALKITHLDEGKGLEEKNLFWVGRINSFTKDRYELEDAKRKYVSTRLE